MSKPNYSKKPFRVTSGNNSSEPHYSKEPYVVVGDFASEGGGGLPANHNHDDRYYTKNEVDAGLDFIAESLRGEAHKVKTFAGDEPDFLRNKVDNITLEVIGSELRVKSLSGLNIGVADLN